ncbi:hypothetical protein GQ44DRAFT_700570 [Phaeosphaeriaceae sp. PMI808]|nr:hypothetical protein GQ44DRAFT_700570 [Phaeosphaeriaceae sp. PMI808]
MMEPPAGKAIMASHHYRLAAIADYTFAPNSVALQPLKSNTNGSIQVLYTAPILFV